MQDRDLKFSDWPMFDHIMEKHPDICRRLLEVVLGMPVAAVENITAERAILPRLGSLGVRLDVIMHAGGVAYDVEMQCYSRGKLGRRMRYNQSSMDSLALKPGEDYDRLPQSFIVFICTFDPFEHELPVYTFDMICDESAHVSLDHGFKWVVLNASAWRSLPAGELKDLLHYIQEQSVSDDRLVNDIATAVEEANDDAAWRQEGLAMITLEEDLRAQARMMKEAALEQGLAEGRAEGRAEGLAEGRTEGVQQGEERMAALVAFLLEHGRSDDALAAASDPARRADLLEECGLYS